MPSALRHFVLLAALSGCEPDAGADEVDAEAGADGGSPQSVVRTCPASEPKPESECAYEGESCEYAECAPLLPGDPEPYCECDQGKCESGPCRDFDRPAYADCVNGRWRVTPAICHVCPNELPEAGVLCHAGDQYSVVCEYPDVCHGPQYDAVCSGVPRSWNRYDDTCELAARCPEALPLGPSEEACSELGMRCSYPASGEPTVEATCEDYTWFPREVVCPSEPTAQAADRFCSYDGAPCMFERCSEIVANESCENRQNPPCAITCEGPKWKVEATGCGAE